MGEKQWTVLEILKETTLFFEKKGIPNPRLDAEVLLAHVLDMDRVGLYLNFGRPLTDKEVSTYRGFVLRRAKREPLQYITGRKEFWSLDFKVGKGVLIPRQETEVLVEKAFETLSVERQCEGALTLLDIGTGCGVIAITLAKEFKESRIWALDLSSTAIEFAVENASIHGVLERITFLHGKYPEAIKGYLNFFHAILSNPPYIKTSDIPYLQKEISGYEPITALNGGEDGLEVIRTIISTAYRYLKRGGWLFLEVGEGQALMVLDMLKGIGEYTSIEAAKDLSGIDRVIIARAA